MPTKCPECDAEVRSYEKSCPACDAFVGYPNVRAAEQPLEQLALERRFSEAQAASASQNCEDILKDFVEAVSRSKAVICRSLSQVRALASDDSELYASFYMLVFAGVRRPPDTDANWNRAVADDLLFPLYREHIRFAALSLDELGAKSWGNCAMVLKDTAVRKRATVFEKNSLYFCQERKLFSAWDFPPGYRATWDARAKLAAAKLHPQLGPKTQESAFAQILLKPSKKKEEYREDFVEVHIYGPLHRESLDRVVVRKPKRRADQVLLKATQRILKDPAIGVTVEVRP